MGTIGRMTPAGCEATARQSDTAQTRIHAGSITAHYSETGMVKPFPFTLRSRPNPKIRSGIWYASAVETTTERYHLLMPLYRIRTRKAMIMTISLSWQQRNGYQSRTDAVIAAVLPFLRTPEGGGSLGGFYGITRYPICPYAELPPRRVGQKGGCTGDR